MEPTTTADQATTQMQQAPQPQQAAQPPQQNAQWAAAAQAAMPTENATTNAKVQPAAQAPYSPPPFVITPQKRGGILGVMDSIASALTGNASKPEIATDQDGNKYVKETTLSHGEQWRRIGGEAIEGAAAGLAAGKGAGNMGRAAEAGVQAGQQNFQLQQQQQKQMTAEARQENLDNANYQMLRMKMAQVAWTASRQKVEATQHDIEFAQGQVDRLIKDGGTILGTAAHPWDISGILKVNPDVMKDMIQKHQIELMPHYNEDGTAAGVTVVKMPDGYRTTVLPVGTVFHTFDQTTGQMVPHESASPMTAGERDDYERAAGIAAQQYATAKAQQAHVEADTAAQNAAASKAPSEIAEAKARTDEAHASAERDRAEATKDRLMSGQGAAGTELVDSIGTGKIAPDRMAYLLTRNPDLLAAVVQKYPDFDSSKAVSYPAVYKDFTSSKNGTAGGALNAGGTALKHLLELSNMNTKKSHIYGTADYTAYKNKVDTVSAELAKFYGDATIPAIDAIKSTLMSTLPGNRQAAIRTQAQSMGDKLDSYHQTWMNAAPSSAYEAPMPGIDDEARQARAALDPAYKQRLQGAPNPRTAQPPPIPQGTAPPAPGMKRVWAPGMPTWRDIPANQVKNIPGQVVQ